MFIVTLTYVCDIVLIEEYQDAHQTFLDRNYAKGIFIASGRKEPRTGGVILALADSRKALHQILEADPFYEHHLATYDITEFVLTKAAPGLSPYLLSC